MNGLRLYQAAPSNIFDERQKQYKAAIHSAIQIIEAQGFRLNSGPKHFVCHDYAMPTCYRLYTFVGKDDASKVMELKVPVVDKALSFECNGNRWIPIFQLCDIPIFLNETTNRVVMYNTYMTLELVCHSNYSMMFMNYKQWPVLLFLMASLGIESALDTLQCKYVFIDRESSVDRGYLARIPITCDQDILILDIPEYFKMLLNPFNAQTNSYHRFVNKVREYATFEEVQEILMTAWEADNRVANLVKHATIIDYATLQNGIFDKPVSMVELLIGFYTMSINVENRKINDISRRRVRLGEWLLYKLSQQYRYNLVNDEKKVSTDAILETISMDSRRMIDDCVNPLSELSLMTRITLNGSGGIIKESCNAAVRNLHDSYKGCIDPIDTPSGESIGLSQHIVPTALIQKGLLVRRREVVSNANA